MTGETEALLVDAGFTRADGHRIVAEILDSGRTLTRVVITAGDPDFYFGAEVIADAFPEATFAAPADVIEHIDHSYVGKLAAWAHLGVNLPTRLVEIAELTDAVLSVEAPRSRYAAAATCWVIARGTSSSPPRGPSSAGSCSSKACTSGPLTARPPSCGPSGSARSTSSRR